MTVELAVSVLFYTVLLGQLHSIQGCMMGDLRTVPDNPDDGRLYLLYCHNGQWRRLCTEEGIWTDSSARVACRQLGYCGYSARGFNCPGDLNRLDTALISPTVRLAAPTCTGTESRIQDCGIVNETSCLCGSLPWLTCQPNIRLVGGPTDNQGRVEVCVDGHWGTVCSRNNQHLAGTFCSQLGYVSDGALTIVSSSSTLSANRPITSCSVQGGGSLRCSEINDNSCNHSMDLEVVCNTYEQLYSELVGQVSSTTKPLPASSTVTCPTSKDPTSHPTVTCPSSEDPTPCPTVTCPTCETPTPSPVIVSSTSPPQVKTESCDYPSSDPSSSFIPVSNNQAVAMSGNTREAQNRTILGAVIGVLMAVIVAMAIGWICTCVIMKKQLTVILSENGEGQNNKALLRELDNPVYEGSHWSQTDNNNTEPPKPSKPVAAEATYDVVDGQGGGAVYSVVEQTGVGGNAVDPQQEYSVLIHNKDNKLKQPPTDLPPEEYSTLQV